MIIKALLVAVCAVVVLAVLSSRSTYSIKAYKKIIFIAFMFFATFFIIFPDRLTSIANYLGVGRGADLLLYALFFAFCAGILNSYNKFKKQQDLLNRLARKFAVLEAKESNKPQERKRP